MIKFIKCWKKTYWGTCGYQLNIAFGTLTNIEFSFSSPSSNVQRLLDSRLLSLSPNIFWIPSDKHDSRFKESSLQQHQILDAAREKKRHYQSVVTVSSRKSTAGATVALCCLITARFYTEMASQTLPARHGMTCRSSCSTAVVVLHTPQFRQITGQWSVYLTEPICSAALSLLSQVSEPLFQSVTIVWFLSRLSTVNV
ncbi:hypothetical protein J6590_004808 [Homalodisca vitripennis]|nr:hypothetical protein J6590_004808 [Homalodisca vitripennis]